MAGTTWPDLMAGRTAKASEVEAKFDWLEGDIVPMSGGSQTDSVYFLGTSGARWAGVYTRSINPTSTAGGVAIGTTTAHASAILDLYGAGALIVPRLTTTQRDALTAVNGMVIYNTTLAQLQKYENSAWKSTGGTLFRTNPMAETSSSSGLTQTALVVASGGGRINGISIRSLSGTGKPSISVVIDGVTIFNWSAATIGAYTYHICPDGDAIRSNLSDPNNLMGPTATASPFLGWDFATSCAIYFRDNSGSTGSHTIKYGYSSIV